jgi:hypothetical protein
VGKVPGLEVYILTFTASKGHNRKSARNSAHAEEIDQPILLYFTAFSSPTIPLYTSLKIS